MQIPGRSRLYKQTEKNSVIFSELSGFISWFQKYNGKNTDYFYSSFEWNSWNEFEVILIQLYN